MNSNSRSPYLEPKILITDGQTAVYICITDDRLWSTLVIQAGCFHVYFSLPYISFILGNIRILLYDESQQEGHEHDLKYQVNER